MIIKAGVYNSGKFQEGTHLLTCISNVAGTVVFQHSTGAFHMESASLPVQPACRYRCKLEFRRGFILEQRGTKYRLLDDKSQEPLSNFHTFKELALVVDQLGIAPAVPTIVEIRNLENELIYPKKSNEMATSSSTPDSQGSSDS